MNRYQKRFLKKLAKKALKLTWFCIKFVWFQLYRYAREILGQTVSNREYMVDAATLKKFREYPLYRFPDRVHIVHIGIDPSGGSTSSDYAICSTVRDNGHFVIIGCDISGSFKQDDILWMLDNHLLKIRQQPQYSNAFFMIYIEANMSWISADGLRTHFGKQPQLGQHLVYSRDPKKLGRPGVWTGESEKELYARGLRKMMHAGQLRYAENFISVGKKVHETKQILEDQLRQLRKETAASSGLEPGFDKVKTTYTGKSHGVRDDACMSLQIALYNMETVRQDPVFIQFCIQKSLAY